MGWRCISLAVLLTFASVGCATVSSREDDGWGRCSGADCLKFLDQVPLTDELRQQWQHNIAQAALELAQAPRCSGADCYMETLRKDFAPFELKGIFKAQLDMLLQQNRGVHYQIIDHHVYRASKCMFTARCQGVEHFLHKLAPELPNIEFVLNVHDTPYIHEHVPLPLFSFSTTPSNADIMYPAWTFWQGGPAVYPLYPTGLGRWDLMRHELILQGERHHWEEKEKVAFFRGSRTSGERDPLVLLSRAKPELANAAYVKNQGYRSPKDLLYAEEAEKVPLEEHCHYAYLFNFRGVAASFRHKHLFLCRSLVFHVGDQWDEFYYGAMKPWAHYIPVSTEMQEVEALLQFFQEHEYLGKQIAAHGFDFIHDNLRMEDVEEYWRRLLLHYSVLQKWAPELKPDLIHIKPPHDEL